MQDYKSLSIGALIHLIENERVRKELWQRVDAIEKEKADYERNYYVQYDEFKLHNRKFGGNAQGIKPPEFNAGMDRLLRNEILGALTEQKERELEKQAEKDILPETYNAAKKAKEELSEHKEEKYATAEDFQKLIDELAAKKKQTFIAKENRPEPLNENIDPRRLAFREQLKAIKEQNAKYKDKGRDREL